MIATYHTHFHLEFFKTFSTVVDVKNNSVYSFTQIKNEKIKEFMFIFQNQRAKHTENT